MLSGVYNDVNPKDKIVKDRYDSRLWNFCLLTNWPIVANETIYNLFTLYV